MQCFARVVAYCVVVARTVCRVCGRDEKFCAALRVQFVGGRGALPGPLHAVCNGLGRGALEDATQYAKDRKAFGRSIGSFQAVQHQLAESLVELDLAQLGTYKAAWMADRKLDCSVPAASAKLFSSEAAFRATDRGMRVLAGAGFTMEYHMQRYYRDIRQLIFAPVTNEMGKNFIAQVGCGLPRSY